MFKSANLNKENNLSNALYITKAFAVISIVLAHTQFNKISNEYIKTFLTVYKLIGVYIFFILSGYFYKKEKYKNAWGLLKDKLVKICIPWVILGTINYLIPVLFNDEFEFSILSYSNYLLGNGSYLYFLTMLMMCYVITYFLPEKQDYLWIALNIISILLTSLNIFPQVVNNKMIVFSYLNPYLNILNWIGIFAIGLMIKRKNWLEKNMGILQNKCIIISLIYVVMYAVACLLRLDITYWNILSMIIGILSFVAILSVSLKLSGFNLLIDVGKKSFFIYQVHLIFLIIFSGLFEYSDVFAILRPILTVIIIYFAAVLGQKTAKILKLEKIYNTILGIR